MSVLTGNLNWFNGEGPPMALEFRVCTVCKESHALRADRLMSIHTNAAGERCEEPSAVSTGTRPEPKRRDPRPDADKPPETKIVDEELEEAFRVARDGSKARLAEDTPKRFDRGIYVTDGSYVIRGGLPTLGRNR